MILISMRVIFINKTSTENINKQLKQLITALF